MPFVKLDCGIIHSSLWAEDSDTKICWITLLLLADQNGFVCAAASAIAREAGIPAEVARRALYLFQSPDDESRTPDNEGKRVEKVDGGYQVLNYEKYRERDYTNAERQKRFRDSKKSNVTTVTEPLPVTARNTSRSRSRSRIEEGSNGSSPASVEDWLKELEADKTYAGIDVRREYGKMLNWCKLRRKQPNKRRFVNWLNQADKPLPFTHSARADYKRNYSTAPTAPEVSDEERARLLKIAAEEKKRLKESFHNNVTFDPKHAFTTDFSKESESG